jgi:protein dpy-30
MKFARWQKKSFPSAGSAKSWMVAEKRYREEKK